MAELVPAALLEAEWLDADGLGGFASGTVAGIRTRRYHALLLAATTPPTSRMVLVNGLEVWLETPGGRVALSAQRYTPDVLYPDGQQRIAAFRHEPWPCWTFCLEDGSEVTQEVVACHERGHVIVRWSLRSLPLVDPVGASPARLGKGPPTPFGPDLPDVLEKGAPTPFRPANGPDPVRTDQPLQLMVRPLLSGRDYHALHHENPAFDFRAEVTGARVLWRPYPGVPPIAALTEGSYRHEPSWYRNFQYDAERERGLDFTEDLASPGVFSWTLNGREATLILSAGEASPDLDARRLLEVEAKRRRFALPLHHAADQYVVRRGQGRTIVAGYPWFTDWGRDTFITLRGFMGLPGGLELARDILLAWANVVSEGMLPNRFPDGASAPEYNAVDASLWYVVAAHEFLTSSGVSLAPGEQAALGAAVGRIVDGYRQGTRFGIAMDHDGLLKAGEPGWQLTWMDAKIGDWVVTPRIGKPVEVQALWLNALKSAGDETGFARGLKAFRERFWNAERGCLFDVVDVDHRSGRNDPAIRPNQILAVGGLPVALLEGERTRNVVNVVERELLTPMGLRSLAPSEPGYRPHYGGDPQTRDAAYHQGSVWPWLIGPFVDAWLRVRGNSEAARKEADARFLQPIRDHLGRAGLGHVCELADAEPPHTPRGCPFQAWSLGELLRASALVDADRSQSASQPTQKSA
jgi:predicted glycogen debranching enzyme